MPAMTEEEVDVSVDALRSMAQAAPDGKVSAAALVAVLDAYDQEVSKELYEGRDDILHIRVAGKGLPLYTIDQRLLAGILAELRQLQRRIRGR